MHEEEKCGCEEGQCSCGSSGCGSECGCGSQGCGCNEGGCEPDMLQMLTYIAREAKMKLLKEKMKKKLEDREGKKLDQMAEIAVEALLQSYKDKMEMEKKQQELRERLDSIFEQR